MIKVLINGCNGTMGQVIANQIKNDSDMTIAAGVDLNPEKFTNDFKVYKNIFDCKDKIDIIIDFSNPNSISNLIKYSTKNHVPLVMGTTGLSNEDMTTLKDAAKNTPIFYSANMSLGINVLVSLVKEVASKLNNSFDIEIIEKHHNKKVDAPSGTAYMIANEINKELNNTKEYVFDRHTKPGPRKNNEIGIHSIRGGTIVGEHDVIFAGYDEVLEIKHTASSKNIFAQGAIKAAKFIVNKDKGFYNMEDMLSK